MTEAECCETTHQLVVKVCQRYKFQFVSNNYEKGQHFVLFLIRKNMDRRSDQLAVCRSHAEAPGVSSLESCKDQKPAPRLNLTYDSVSIATILLILF